MPDLSYADQVKLLTIDKLLLGGVIAIAAFVGNYVLERHKAKQALWSELAKRRARAFAKVYAELDDIGARASALAFELARVYMTTARQLGTKVDIDHLPAKGHRIPLRDI